MQYYFHINQAGIVRANLHTPITAYRYDNDKKPIQIKTDLKDWAILWYLKYLSGSLMNKRGGFVQIGDTRFVRLKYRNIINENPILGITTKRSLIDRIWKLKQFGLIETHQDKTGADLFFRLTDKFFEVDEYRESRASKTGEANLTSEQKLTGEANLTGAVKQISPVGAKPVKQTSPHNSIPLQKTQQEREATPEGVAVAPMAQPPSHRISKPKKPKPGFEFSALSDRSRKHVKQYKAAGDPRLIDFAALNEFDRKIPDNFTSELDKRVYENVKFTKDNGKVCTGLEKVYEAVFQSAAVAAMEQTPENENQNTSQVKAGQIATEQAAREEREADERKKLFWAAVAKMGEDELKKIESETPTTNQGEMVSARLCGIQ